MPVPKRPAKNPYRDHRASRTRRYTRGYGVVKVSGLMNVSAYAAVLYIPPMIDRCHNLRNNRYHL
jgi:hypothetical protein